MCTVVVRWAPGSRVHVLALRDELTTRPFDDPGEWWPDRPHVLGGRDRTAGGSWCVSDVAGGVTAMVLNRPEKRLADAGAPSRGVLPLLGVRHGPSWANHVDVSGMASFSVVLAGPDGLTLWAYDGTVLHQEDLGEGTHMMTSGGAEDGKAQRYLSDFVRTDPQGWRRLVEGQEPADDLAALVVRHEKDGLVYATVFGQTIDAVPGELRLAYSREPWRSGWSERVVSASSTT